MKRLFTICTALMVVMLFLSACAPAGGAAATQPGPITLTDGLGRTVTLEKPAQKIVSLAASNTELLYAVGAGEQIVGRDNYSDYPPEALDLPAIGDLLAGINMEQIAALKPDLVIASELNTPDQVKSLETIGLKVYYLANPDDFPGLYANVETVAKLSGHETQGAVLATQLKERVDSIQKTLANVESKPKVFYELDATTPAQPYTAGAGTFISYLIGQAGGQNVGDSMQSEWAQISQEELIIQNPDIILLGDATYGGVTPEQVASRPGWDGIKAVSEQKVMVFDDNLVSRPGPRMVDGLEQMAKLLHPELFK